MLTQFLKDEEGVFALVTAITLPVLIAASIFGTELGMWAYRHQQMQGATDAAAIAGVIAGVPGSPRIVQGRAVTAASGFVHGVDGVSVTINSPPASGPYASRSDAVEAIIQRSYAPLIAKFISGNPVVVRARSVALPNLSGGACVLALNNSESDAMTVWGSATVSLNGCNAVSNSSHASAISAGGSGTLKVASAISAGGISGENRIVAQNGLVRNATPLDDPYESRSYPEFDKNAARSFPRSGAISPGVYKGDIKGAITMSPGIYYVDAGSFKLNGGGSLAGDGVTIVLTNITGWPSGPLINGNSDIKLTAPASGPTAGVVLFGDRSMPADTDIKINGGSAQSWGGAIYLPRARLTYIGGASGTTGCTQIIADRVTFSGDSNLSLSCEGSGVSPITMQKVLLVE